MSNSINYTSSSSEMFLTQIGLGAEFPVGLRVMAIDSDFGCLNFLVGLLGQCNFTARGETSARNALERVYNQKEDYDIIVTEVTNLDFDAFEVLEHMRKRMPVLVLSNLDDNRTIMKAVIGGVADYMLKPASLEMMKNIWQHVLRSRLNNYGNHTWRNSYPSPSPSPNPNPNSNPSPSPSVLMTEGKTSIEKQQQYDSLNETSHPQMPDTSGEEGKNNEEHGGGSCDDDSNPMKKTRIYWARELHNRFVEAVNELQGPDNAKPKQILERMNVPSLSREKVASHLQKYRLYLKNQLKVQPIWTEETNNESISYARENGVEGNEMANNVFSSTLTTGLIYPHHDYYTSMPINNLHDLYISNPLEQPTSSAIFGRVSHVMTQQPAMPPGGNNYFSNNLGENRMFP